MSEHLPTSLRLSLASPVLEIPSPTSSKAPRTLSRQKKEDQGEDKGRRLRFFKGAACVRQRRRKETIAARKKKLNLKNLVLLLLLLSLSLPFSSTPSHPANNKQHQKPKQTKKSSSSSRPPSRARPSSSSGPSARSTPTQARKRLQNTRRERSRAGWGFPPARG